MGFPPEVFVIGAQKAGTTFLASLLDQHLDITLARPKEPGFYTRHWEKGLDWYERCFPTKDSKVLIDASTSYSAARLRESDSQFAGEARFAGVPGRIHAVVPNARFIYVMRDPVQRTYSSYWHYVRQGTETLSFREAIEKDSYYLRVSDYAGQLGLYFEHFPRSAFLLLLFEDLIKSPEETAKQCFQFLKLEEDINLRLDGGRNQSFTYRGWLAKVNRAFAQRGGISRLIKIARPLIPANLRMAFGNMMTRKIPPMLEEDRKFLVHHFKDKKPAVERLLKRSIEQWQC